MQAQCSHLHSSSASLASFASEMEDHHPEDGHPNHLLVTGKVRLTSSGRFLISAHFACQRQLFSAKPPPISNLHKSKDMLCDSNKMPKWKAYSQLSLIVKLKTPISISCVYSSQSTFLLLNFVLSPSREDLTPFLSPSTFSKSSKEASPSASNRIPLVGCFFFCRSLA